MLAIFHLFFFFFCFFFCIFKVHAEHSVSEGNLGFSVLSPLRMLQQEIAQLQVNTLFYCLSKINVLLRYLLVFKTPKMMSVQHLQKNYALLQQQIESSQGTYSTLNIYILLAAEQLLPVYVCVVYYCTTINTIQ